MFRTQMPNQRAAGDGANVVRLGSRTRLAAALFMAVVSVQPASADTSLAGAWSGNGSVTLPSGASEKARCKATFRKRGANSFAMDAVCASSSARVVQTASLEQIGPNRYAGDFTNAEYNISGSIKLTISGNNLSAALNGGGGSANFNLSR
jgi:hypothetical protein